MPGTITHRGEAKVTFLFEHGEPIAAGSINVLIEETMRDLFGVYVDIPLPLGFNAARVELPCGRVLEGGVCWRNRTMFNLTHGIEPLLEPVF